MKKKKKAFNSQLTFVNTFSFRFSVRDKFCDVPVPQRILYLVSQVSPRSLHGVDRGVGGK